MRRLRLAVLVGALALAAGACSPSRPADDAGPPGALLSARTADLARLLGLLTRFEGTPLARRAAALAAQLPACEEVEAQAAEASLDALAHALHCRTGGGPLEALRRERGGAALAFAWPLAAGPRLRGRAEVGPGGRVRVSLRVPAAARSGPAALLLPGAEPPGPEVLSDADALAHLRLRPAAGLDLAALVPEGSQGDRLFRLRSALFAGAVLDGTWEAAVYLPDEGDPVPPVALALGFSQRALAVAAAEHFVAELMQTWPVRRSSLALDGAEGACLLDLRVLPGFAPCYVATARAIVLGYNSESLRRALAGGGPGAAGGGGLGAAGGLVLDLARLPEADARLARAAGDAAAAARPALPWQQVRADGRLEGGAVHLEIALEPGAGA